MNKRFGGAGGSFGMKAVKSHAEASINLTPMIDMMVVLMIFLVKTFSVEPQFLTKTQDIQLAQTESELSAPNAPVLIIGKDGVWVEGKVIVPFKEGLVSLNQMDKKGVIPELQSALLALAEKTKKISERDPTVVFNGVLILQADKDIPFESLRPILKTAGLSGFQEFKFAGTAVN